MLFIGEQLQIEQLTPELIKGTDFPLILLVLMIGVIPTIKPVRNAEAGLRSWFHRQAFIPSQATALSKPTRFSPEPDEAADLIEDLQDYLPTEVELLYPSHDLWHKWFKLLYLRKKITEWKQEPRINQFTFDFSKAYKENHALFYELKRELKYYARRCRTQQQRTQTAESADDLEYTDQEADNLALLKGKLVKQIDLLLTATYQCICCGILSTERNETSRREKFKFFDLFPNVEEQLPFVADSLLKAMLFVLTVTSLTSTLFHYIRTQNLNLLQALDVGLLHTVMQGICISLAIFIFRKYKRSGWLKPQGKQHGLVIGPLLRRMLGASFGYLATLIILGFWIALRAETSLPEAIANNWFWPLPVAVTSCFIIHYLSVIEKKSVNTWREGLLQALAQGFVGLLVTIMAVTEHRTAGDPVDDLALILYVTLTLSLTGWCIGRVFPSEYRKVLKAHHRERRCGERVKLVRPATVISEQEYQVDETILSVSGASLPIELPDESALRYNSKSPVWVR